MTIPRATFLGVLAAFSVVFLAHVGGHLGDVMLAILCLPIAALLVVGVLEQGVAGWRWRLARSAVGTVLAGVAAFGLVRVLLRLDWFEIHEPAVLLALCGLAGACGGISAAARPGRGLALAWGFIVGFVVLMLPTLAAGDWRQLGFVVGFVLTLGAGATVGAVLGAAAK